MGSSNTSTPLKKQPPEIVPFKTTNVIRHKWNLKLSTNKFKLLCHDICIKLFDL
jgi:hypothetical protein